MSPRAVIVGPPGSGKSTVGLILAKQLGVSFLDADDEIVVRAEQSISDIFTDLGEPAFRALEEQVIADALANHEGVLSLGGGAVLSAVTRRELVGHNVIFLSVGMSEGVQRVGLSSARPLLAGVNPRATYKSLLDARLPIYREVAVLEIETDQRTPDEVATVILEKLASPAKEHDD